MPGLRACVTDDILAMLPLVQPRQSFDAAQVTDALAARLCGPDSWAWTATHDEELLGCGGLMFVMGATAHGWAFFRPGIGAAHMLAITRFARARLAESAWDRIEATAEADWPQANKWLRLLGFEHRCLMRKWGPAAIDMNLWEIIR